MTVTWLLISAKSGNTADHRSFVVRLPPREDSDDKVRGREDDMPKYCCVFDCKNDSANNDNRRSFYKLPLHEPDRVLQWLKNMGREDWTPSKHQYICHEHFTPSCFKVRWGIRYLEHDAVPTVFKAPVKRKSIDHSQKKAKRLRCNVKGRTPLEDNGTQPVAVTAPLGSSSSTVEPHDIRDTVDFLRTDLHTPTSVDRFDTGMDFPVTSLQTVEDATGLDRGENAAVVVVSQCPAAEEEDDLLSGITAAILAHQREMVVSESLTGHAVDTQTALCVENVTPDMEELSVVPSGHEAYFETIPNLFLHCAPLSMPSCAISPETVLSALSSTPIVSTVPIVSKHTLDPWSALVLTTETLYTEGEPDTPVGSTEQQENQLEEHCYHKDSLSKEQLEAVVAKLQKKVKVLQQRHRRHLEKLLGLENTVKQLRHSNLLNHQRLQLLERAYIQTSTAGSHTGEWDTVAVKYQQDDGAYIYAPVHEGGQEI